MRAGTSFDGHRSALLDWGPLVGGSALALFGLTRSKGAAVPLTVAGAALAFYSLAGGSGRRELTTQSVHADRSVTVKKPVEEVYGFWNVPENLPRVMPHLASVERTGERRYRFTIEPPFTDRRIEWESEITEQRPNEVISWRSVPGSPIDHTGTVYFRPAPADRGTEIHIAFDYRPGTSATAVAGHVFRPVAAQTLKQEIRNFKAFMEAGEIATIEGQPTARRA